MSEKEVRILKTGECPSLSGKSTLTYQNGCNNDNEIFIKLAENSGGGRFSPDWVPLEQVYTILSSQKKPVTSGSLHGLFENRSSNSAGFILAVLLKEGLLKISPGNSHYDLIGQTEFRKIVQELIDSGTAKKKASKKRVPK